MKNGAQISASTFAQGDAGNVEINATETVVVDRANSGIFTGVVSNVEAGAEGNRLRGTAYIQTRRTSWEIPLQRGASNATPQPGLALDLLFLQL